MNFNEITNYVKLRSFLHRYKRYSKNKIISLIVLTSAQINRTNNIIDNKFEKELKAYSKAQLIRTLLILDKTLALKPKQGKEKIICLN